MRRMSDNGFTLIELMIVVAILGILAVVGIGSYFSSQLKARDGRRKSDISQIGRALEAYANDFGKYPNGSGGQIMGCGSGGSSACSWGSDFTASFNGSSQYYMPKLPNDPAPGAHYYYISDGQTYAICSTLENGEDQNYHSTVPTVNSETCDCGLDCHYQFASSGVVQP